ncbi:SLBB domain-containing protein [Desulfosediminicola flagellatus]|uniref:SLBB domain-containing protein n=1 Tax=Desulfosediminicola flagellatus TaxID=2569541 RepID=UPI001E4E720F|nr:polysaccharide biosynthesis/export family protein [Desulfosediminicola flagellatus]
MIKNILLSLLFLLQLAEPAVGQDYIVGENDVLKVTVYNHNDLTTTVRVSGDGTINLPLLNKVKVAGLTSTQISDKITARLAGSYIVNPQVNVFIEDFRSKKVVILGQVNKPGLYELQGRTTFLELISKAGGLTKEAGDKTIIKRKQGANASKEPSILTIDMNQLIEEGETSQNIETLDGDNIYIAKAGVFYVSGEVKKPNAYKFEENLTVIKAITRAGGFSDDAKEGSVSIIRQSNGRELVLEKIEMNEPVLQEDIILVPYRGWR